MRDLTIRFALHATMPDMPLCDARVDPARYGVAQTSLTQDVAESTFTDFYGTSGTCSAQNSGATGGGTIVSASTSLVFRPSSDAVFDLVCVDPFVRFGMSVDLLRVAASIAEPGRRRNARRGPADVGERPHAAAAAPARSRRRAHRRADRDGAGRQRELHRAPQVSPDGSTVAYHFFNTGVSSDRANASVAYTRAGDRLVAVGDQNDLRLYDVTAPAPAAPALRCTMTGFSGDVSDPTWSPEGDALAWEEADGIHVAEFADLAGCASAARPLTVPGGTDPDWGPPPRPPRRDPALPADRAPAASTCGCRAWRAASAPGRPHAAASA